MLLDDLLTLDSMKVHLAMKSLAAAVAIDSSEDHPMDVILLLRQVCASVFLLSLKREEEKE